jgi:hypothetical protein
LGTAIIPHFLFIAACAIRCGLCAQLIAARTIANGAGCAMRPDAQYLFSGTGNPADKQLQSRIL